MTAPREMRRARREVTELAELRSIVDRSRVLHVGSSDDEGPFVVPMSYGYEVLGEKDDEPRWVFWMHSAGEGRKAEAWSQMDLTVVAPTQWMKRVAEESVLLRGREVHVIPNGLDLAQHYPVDKQLARKALRIPEGRKVILFGAINAFDPRKGLRCLVDALRMLSAKHAREYFLVVFGMGKRDLGTGIPARFLGYLSDQYTLQLAYSAADVMAVPSLEEAFGQTVTEAMACATPVVAFRETGPESIIEHKVTGYLANYADTEDLAAGIEWILSSTERTDRLSGNARQRMEMSYDIRIVARQYEQLFHRLTNP